MSPAETASFAGSLPTFSNGKTAIDLPGVRTIRETRSRTGGRNESTASDDGVTPTPTSHRGDLARGQRLPRRDARLVQFACEVPAVKVDGRQPDGGWTPEVGALPETLEGR